MACFCGRLIFAANGESRIRGAHRASRTFDVTAAIVRLHLAPSIIVRTLRQF